MLQQIFGIYLFINVACIGYNIIPNFIRQTIFYILWIKLRRSILYRILDQYYSLNSSYYFNSYNRLTYWSSNLLTNHNYLNTYWFIYFMHTFYKKLYTSIEFTMGRYLLLIVEWNYFVSSANILDFSTKLTN